MRAWSTRSCAASSAADYPIDGPSAYTARAMTRCPQCGEENPERARFCLACGRQLPVAGAVQEVRKTVTVLFSDLSGSTALGERMDPESLRGVMSRYFEAMRQVIERHGGTVEKFIGDAVMAVFGTPVIHEDDALRAVRSALEMRIAMETLNADLAGDARVAIRARIGINTGEVVAGDSTSRQALVTGDAVNVAARLEQSAEPGEILIGEETYRLVRDLVLTDADGARELAVKGKSEPVRSYRVVGLQGDGGQRSRHFDAPMVGRDRELRLLAEALERAERERACHLFTLLGAAGVGKSRLLHEFLASAARDATVLRGRCLPYGDGITYWPLAEAVRGVAGIEPTDAPDVALAKLAGVVEAAGGDERVTSGVAVAIGLREGSSSAEDLAWSARRFFELLAGSGPLVIIFDDLHWAELAFLELVENIADWARDAPILLVCVARPDLLELQPAWGGGKLNATTILLEPLDGDESAQLVSGLLGAIALDEALLARIAEGSEGNPLFVEEVIAMLVDDGALQKDEGTWRLTGDVATLRVPPSVSALLAARLDRLSDPERDVLGRASVVGKIFDRTAVTELSEVDAQAQVPLRLRTLVRKELIRPDRGALSDDEAYRFRHLLIRDAAYAALPKSVRADLHERFADWLQESLTDRLSEYEEIVAYHLEEAHRYRQELAPADPAVARLAEKAAGHLDAAAIRAGDRSDSRAAAKLLSRALALLPTADPRRAALLADLADYRRELGDVPGAEAVQRDLLDAAAHGGDERFEAHARLLAADIRSQVDPLHRIDVEVAACDYAEVVFRRLGDENGLVRVLLAKYQIAIIQCHWQTGMDYASEARRHVSGARGHLLDMQARRGQLNALLWGPFAADEAVAQGEALMEGVDEVALPRYEAFLAPLRAMSGSIPLAQEIIQRTRAHLRDTGMRSAESGLSLRSWMVGMVAGDLEQAGREAEVGIAIQQEIGETGVLSTLAAMLAETRVRQGRLDEAEEASRMSEETASVDDVTSQIMWRAARGQVHARRGDVESGERLAREAVDIAEKTDFTYLQAASLEALAVVLSLAGRPTDARVALEAARERYGAKGDQPDEARLADQLAREPA
jgi:class 3 adenylate cyclase